MEHTYLSIIIPVYHGAETITTLFEKIKEVCENRQYTYEVIFVWDCGTDNSWAIIQQLQKTHNRTVKGIHLSRNFGQHNALICGFQYASGKWFVTMDEDLQNLPADIESLLDQQKIKNSDVVYGIHERQNHAIFRNITSRILQKLIQSGVPGLHKDYSAFRLIKKETAKSCLKMQDSYTFLDGYLSWITNSFDSCSVQHQKRVAGQSSYTIRKLIRHSVNIFVTFSDLPMKMVAYTSFLLLLFAMGYSSLVFIQKVFYDMLIPGFASTIIILSLGFGSILLALGIIGQYIHRINLKTTKRPNFLVKKII